MFRIIKILEFDLIIDDSKIKVYFFKYIISKWEIESQKCTKRQVMLN